MKPLFLGLLLLTSSVGATAHAEAHSASGASGAAAESQPFRERARAEMEAVLGQPLRIHQDAINAAYLAVGWTWGADTPTPLDNAAYRKAWSWGFRIEVFAETRDEPFATDVLAGGPLRMDSEYALTLARTQGRIDRMQAEALAARRNAPNPDWRIDEVEERVAAAEQELARITRELASLEQSARSREPRSGKLRPEVDALGRSLDETEGSVGSLADELREVSREVEARESEGQPGQAAR
jgi:hypothetical protein